MKKLAPVLTLVFAVLSLVTAQAQEDLYVSTNNSIGQYNETTGATINAQLAYPTSGSTVLAPFDQTGFLSLSLFSLTEYNTTTGAYISANLDKNFATNPVGVAYANNTFYMDGSSAIATYNTVTKVASSISLQGTTGTPASLSNLAVSGNFLYVGAQTAIGASEIQVVNLTTNTVVNTSLTGTIAANYLTLATSGNNLYVGTEQGNQILEFNLSSGALENTITADDPSSLVANGSDLYSLSESLAHAGNISEYSLSGTELNSDLFHVQNATALLLDTPQSAPEPSTWAMLGLGLFALGFWRNRSARRA